MNVMNAPEWISAVFTAVIAIATIVYVVYTRRLWNETKLSADAAKASADAAKKSADLAAAMHQPLLEVSEVRFVLPSSALGNVARLQGGPHELRLTFKNYGSASAFDIDIELAAGVASRQANRTFKTGLALAPAGELPASLFVSIPTADLNSAQSGMRYSVLVRCTYTAQNRQRRYEYRTERSLSVIDLGFTVESNGTTELPV